MGFGKQLKGKRYRSRLFRRQAAAATTYGQVELKFHDLDIDDAVVAANGTIAEDSVVAIAQGVTETDRLGRKCVVKNINWRFDLRLPVRATATGGLSDVVRVILYHDKQANGATAAITDILESDDYQSFNNLANKARFRTLMDRTYNLDAPGGQGDGAVNDSNEMILSDSFYKRVNIPLEFSAGTGAITELRSSNIGVLLLSKAGLCDFESKMRIRFVG